MAVGAEKVRNSKSSTTNSSSSARNKTISRSLEDFCCSWYRPPYSTRMEEGKCKIVDGFLHRSDAGAQVHAFETRGDLHQALQIFAANFRLAGIDA